MCLSWIFFISPLHLFFLCAIIHSIISNDEAAAAEFLQRAGGWWKPEDAHAFPLLSCRRKPGGLQPLSCVQRGQGAHSPFDNLGGTAEAMLSSHMQKQCVGRRHFFIQRNILKQKALKSQKLAYKQACEEAFTQRNVSRTLQNYAAAFRGRKR